MFLVVPLQGFGADRAVGALRPNEVVLVFLVFFARELGGYLGLLSY